MLACICVHAWVSVWEPLLSVWDTIHTNTVNRVYHIRQFHCHCTYNWCNTWCCCNHCKHSDPTCSCILTTKVKVLSEYHKSEVSCTLPTPIECFSCADKTILNMARMITCSTHRFQPQSAPLHRVYYCIQYTQTLIQIHVHHTTHLVSLNHITRNAQCHCGIWLDAMACTHKDLAPHSASSDHDSIVPKWLKSEQN